MNIKLIQELRQSTGAGLLMCKKALVEANWNLEKAIEIVRVRSDKKIEAKQNRITAEGIVVSFIDKDVGVLLELNCETDFASKHPDFKIFAESLAATVVYIDRLTTVKELLSFPVVELKIWELKTRFGENITIRRFVRYKL